MMTTRFTMYTSFIFYWFLFAITIAETHDKKSYPLHVSPGENLNHIKKHGLKPFCCELTVKSNGHKNKNYPEIPLDIIMKLNQVKSVSELFEKFIPHVNMSEVLKYETTNDSQNSTIVPKPATCTTENHTVSLRDDDNPNLYYSPTCTRVNRCGGCCGNNLLSCQPIEVETLNFEVTIIEYNGTFTFKEKKIISVEQHVKCKCDCIVKEQDCKHSQTYDSRECRCVCNNIEDQNKCDKEPETKIWDYDTCSCQCTEEKECTTGFYFNYNTCRCDPKAD